MYLRCFDWIQKVAIHATAGVFSCSNSKFSPNNRFLDSAEKVIQEKLRSETGINLNIPDHKYGGTTTTVTWPKVY